MRTIRDIMQDRDETDSEFEARLARCELFERTFRPELRQVIVGAYRPVVVQ